MRTHNFVVSTSRVSHPTPYNDHNHTSEQSVIMTTMSISTPLSCSPFYTAMWDQGITPNTIFFNCSMQKVSLVHRYRKKTDFFNWVSVSMMNFISGLARGGCTPIDPLWIRH